MFHVTIVGFEHAYASAITGALDLFSLAGITWERMQGEAPKRQFKVQLASLEGEPVRCINQVTLQSHIPLEAIDKTDLLLIPTIGGDIDKVLQANCDLLPHIRRHYQGESDIASNCSGAFLLAQSGILDGKPATTHWGYADKFRRQFPKVDLQPEQMITQSDNLFCAGGGMAWFDLALLLIERYCGHDTASQSAKAHVIDRSRGNQGAYAQLRSKKYHQDPDILRAQQWMESQFHRRVSIEEAAKQAQLSPRTFNRRFKQATAMTPLAYLQALRIDAAKKALESEAGPIEDLLQNCGYEDLSSFTQLFKRTTGLSPSQYRKRFAGY